MLRLSDYKFDLPEELIASEPLADRAASRMLTVNRSEGTFRDRNFAELTRILRPGDLLVLNDTKVFPARLFGITDTGAKVEIFLINEVADTWEALARPARRLKPGKRISFGNDLSAKVVETGTEGRVRIDFDLREDLFDILDKIGRTPLPPYIKRDANAADGDRERYQTVYAAKRGAIAAPTAGLHFTPTILEELGLNGVEIVEITLHVGYGTFEPIRVNDLSEHRVLPERFEIGRLAAERLNAAKNDGRRVIAVGTTTTRTLEYLMQRSGRFEADSGTADLTILPGYRFRAIDGILTNFHLPESSLLVMISSFAGYELIMRAYKHSVESRYRFYSYGDCMLIV
jgi:S-adenosylmethionine:tRNA ribosyltransferase-isomerase